MSLLIVGSIAMDSVSTPHGKLERGLGGSAVYAGIASSFFTKPRIVGVVGEDFPTEYIALLKKKKCDLKGMQIVPGGKTFLWKGRYEGDMSSAITLDTRLNVFEFFKPELPRDYRNSEFVFLANIDPELQLNVLDQLKKPKLVLCDTMNFWIEGKRDALLEVFRRSDVILVNEGEAFLLTGRPNLIRASRDLLEMGPSHVIIKKGGHGAFIASRSDYFCVPAYPLDSLKDPTGAGDTFAGGLIGFMASRPRMVDSHFRRAMVVGTILASFVCEEFSVKGTASLTRAALKKRIELFHRYMKIPRVEI